MKKNLIKKFIKTNYRLAIKYRRYNYEKQYFENYFMLIILN